MMSLKFSILTLQKYPNKGKDIHKHLAIRLEHYATAGLPKDLRKKVGNKYLIPGNCKVIDASQLNPEIKAAVSEQIAKRDKNI